jgi:hypothetical protein
MPEIKKQNQSVPGWRVAVNLIDGTDFNIDVPTRAAALSRIEAVIASGLITADRSKDRSKYDSVTYPLHQIKSFHVYYEAEEV